MAPALLILLAASSAAPDPASLRASLDRSLPPIETMGACADKHPRYEPRYQRAYAGYVELEAAAESIFGPRPTLGPWDDAPGFSGCGGPAFERYEALARKGLAEARARLSDVTARMRGLWFGTMPICRAQVQSATVDWLYEEHTMASLSLELVPAMKARLRAETEGRVGKAMSLRIDGEAVMAPVVNEPLTAGTVMVSGPERGELERIRAAALRECE